MITLSLQKVLLELTDLDGPNIPQRTLAIYCGIGQSQLNRFMKTGSGISEEKQAQVRKGLQELAQEIYGMVKEIEV